MKEHRRDIDLIKGIAILGVVLFHLGLVKSGYLGVDAFFVINGFLLIPSMCRKIANRDFSFGGFLKKRITRLWPLIILASVVCLLIGYWVMLPDDYENLSQSVISNMFFSQNILSSITVSDYWNTVNDYKPLMHLWYVGILMEFYVVLPLILIMTCNCADIIKIDRMKAMIGVIGILTLVSLLLFMSPLLKDGDKFYLLPCRFFEISIGGMLAIIMEKSIVKIGGGKIISYTVCGICVFLIYSSLFRFDIHTMGSFTPVVGDDTIYDEGIIMPRSLLLLLTVSFSVGVCLLKNDKIRFIPFEWLGKRSYSIFIWHQVFLAFYRYCISNEITVAMIVYLLLLTVLFSELTNRLVEQRMPQSNKGLLFQVGFATILLFCSFNIYSKAGVMRDIPELDIKRGEGVKGMFASYCDRNYKYDKDFEINGKLNILVAGVSFGRDFCNVIQESSVKDSVNISYIIHVDSLPNYKKRLATADLFFIFAAKHKIPKEFWGQLKPTAAVYGIGSKAFGTNMGVVYFGRDKADYYESTVRAIPGLIDLNLRWKDEWGSDRYIDYVSPVLIQSGRAPLIKVFTPEHKFISQDCRHLTPAGAKWYAKELKIDSIIMSHKHSVCVQKCDSVI